VPDGHSFALCLTHDVDRPYKTYQAAYDAVRERSPRPLGTALPGRNPYWQFETVTDLEADLGVRSAFYFLDEPPLPGMGGPSAWLRPTNWVEHLGRYDPAAPALAGVIQRLDDGGWEVGLHGSRRASRDRGRLRREKRRLERVLGHPVRGCRHHHLALSAGTWRDHRAVGLGYDATLGSSTSYGFDYGYAPLRPAPDETGFVVFPLTAMEVALPDPGESFADARDACERLCREAARNAAVMTVLWHPRYFSEAEFPGYRRLYRHLVDYALDAGAWVGPPGDLLDHLAPTGATPAARPGDDADERGREDDGREDGHRGREDDGREDGHRGREDDGREDADDDAGAVVGGG
jgi:hypothetical protein